MKINKQLNKNKEHQSRVPRGLFRALDRESAICEGRHSDSRQLARRNQQRSAVFTGDKLGATVLGRLQKALREVIRKTPAESHVVAFSIEWK